MNFGLLWIDALVGSLLWVTAAAAWVGRVTWVRVAWIIVALVPLAAFGSLVFAAAMTKFQMKIEPNWFNYSVSLLSAYLVGTAVILRQASRREPGLVPAAASWKRVPLTLAWLAAVAVGYMILMNMDFAIRARCAVLSVEINSLYLATSPAITSDSQNAAPLYEKAFARLRDDPPTDVNNPPTGAGVKFDPNEPATISFLARQAGTINLLRQAAALPGCRFDQDILDLEIRAMIPNLNETRNAANVLELHAREELAHGHAASAIADDEAVLKMSRQFGRRPLLVCALVGNGIDILGDRNLQEALSAVKSRDDLSALHLEELGSMGRTFQQALRGEESFGLRVYGNMPAFHTEMDNGNAVQVQDTSLLSSGVELRGAYFRIFVLDTDAYVKLMEEFQKMAIQPYYQVRDQLRDVYGAKRSGGLFLSILTPVLLKAFEGCAEVEAMDECAVAAVAMTRFKLDHGAFPAHLDDLVPAYLEAVPLDPFDGKPLRLAVRDGQWVVYSVGPDLVDDGGVEMDGHGKGDVIFTLRTSPSTNP
jgi:hypothetical protein